LKRNVSLHEGQTNAESCQLNDGVSFGPPVSPAVNCGRIGQLSLASAVAGPRRGARSPSSKVDESRGDRFHLVVREAAGETMWARCGGPAGRRRDRGGTPRRRAIGRLLDHGGVDLGDDERELARLVQREPIWEDFIKGKEECGSWKVE
jgi:hypothetical protein